MADVSALLAGPSSTWALDATRTTVAFRSSSFWGLLKVKGTFTKVEGTGQATAPDLVGGHLRIDAALGEHRHRQTRRPPQVGRLLRRREVPDDRRHSRQGRRHRTGHPRTEHAPS